MPILVPPAGTQIPLGCYFRAVRRAVTDRGLEAALAEKLGVRYARGMCSGRAALVLILRALHHLRPTRSIVVLPAYTCYSVAASIVRAGLQLKLVDINPETVDFDYSALDRTDGAFLCIIAGNLFGIPSDVQRLRIWAESVGAYVVDDAAQSLGAKCDGQSSGTRGDVGLYSMGRGKGLGVGCGGLAITDSDEIAAAIDNELKGYDKREIGGMLLVRSAVTSILLRPQLYWIPDRMPFLKLGTTEFNPEFKITRMPALAAAMTAELLANVALWNERRGRIAEELSVGLARHNAFFLPKVNPCCQSAYVRYPIVASSRTIRDAAVRSLREAGFGASAYYPSAICDIPGVAKYMTSCDFHCVQAENLARTVLTLPVHALVSRSDTAEMIRILQDISVDRLKR